VNFFSKFCIATFLPCEFLSSVLWREKLVYDKQVKENAGGKFHAVVRNASHAAAFFTG